MDSFCLKINRFEIINDYINKKKISNQDECLHMLNYYLAKNYISIIQIASCDTILINLLKNYKMIKSLKFLTENNFQISREIFNNLIQYSNIENEKIIEELIICQY